MPRYYPAKTHLDVTYFIQGQTGGNIKIGYASNLSERLDNLQTGNSDTLRVVGALQGNVEKELHEEFDDLHVRGEWFRASEPLIDFIRKNCKGCDVLSARNKVILTYALPTEVLFTVQQVAAMLQVTQEQILYWIRKGDITAVNVTQKAKVQFMQSGRPRWRIREKDVRKFIDERTLIISPEVVRPTRKRKIKANINNEGTQYY